MKAIIIQDSDAAALLDSLRLARFDAAESFPMIKSPTDYHEMTEKERQIYRQLVEATHRRFHYIVTRWLQEQGASPLR